MRGRLLLLDRGNSHCKWLLLDGAVEQRRGVDDFDAALVDLGRDIDGTRALVASVAGDVDNAALRKQLEDAGCRPWFARAAAETDGLVNSYTQPERMGVDRWLAMLAARRRAPGRLCVVDAGSALTIDLVDESGAHEGGFIIPGTRLMQRALFADTDRVRFDSAVSPSLAPGRSTAEAVANGLLLAQAGAVRLALETAAANGPAPTVLLCGGAARALQAALEPLELPHLLLAAPDLVFEGLLIQARAEGVLPPDHAVRVVD